MKPPPRLLIIFVFCYLLFLYAPVMLLPIFAFNDSQVIALPLSGFSTRWFVSLGREQALFSALNNSLIIASIAAVLSTCLGTLVARAASRHTFPMKRSIMAWLMLPLVLPEVILGVSLLTMLSQMGIRLTIWTVIMGHVLLCSPFAIAILLAAFNAMDKNLEEASLDLGASRIKTFFLVTMPIILPGILAALLISFTISLDEFIIAFFLTGTDATLPVYIWSQLRFPSKLPLVMALGFIMLVASLALLAGGEYFRNKSTKKG